MQSSSNWKQSIKNLFIAKNLDILTKSPSPEVKGTENKHNTPKDFVNYARPLKEVKRINLEK